MRAQNTLKVAQVILIAILLLFFLQALSDFIESIYAFGLLVTAFTVQISAVLLLFTPLLLLFFKHRELPNSVRPWIIVLACLAMLSRLLEPMLDPGGRLVACGVSVGAFMLLFPTLLATRPPKPSVLASGLLIAVSLSIFLRTANSSLDLSESGNYQVIAWALALLAGALILRLAPSPSTQGAAGQTVQPKHSPTARIIGLCLGLASVILLIYFSFASPAVIARWTGYSYPAIVSVLVATFALFALLMNWMRFIERLSPRLILGWNALFTLMLVMTILPHQIIFPGNPAAYPVNAPLVSSLAMLPLFLMLLLSPIVFIDLALYVRQISEDAPSIGQIGGSFALATLFLFVMILFHVFTSIYDYAAPIGPLFRDRFWLVYLLAGLGMELPFIFVRKEVFILDKPETAAPFAPVMVGSLAILSIGALFAMAPKPVGVPASSSQLKIMTYNIQQGFDRAGNENLAGQLDVIRQAAPDILGLQESDTARIANGNNDAVRYFADNLNMYSYYGPATTTGTFGIALLSKYPIEGANTFFMYSKGEQTAAIHAQIIAGDGKTYNIFVTHLGNDGPMIQAQNLLTRMQAMQDVIVMGDYNFQPNTEQYLLITHTLADAWLLRWPGGKDIPGLSSDGLIDHIFVSPSIRVLDSEYIVGTASDHPYLYAIIAP